ncbi:hypothetical protein JYA61_12005, partial [Sphingomonas pseudosanguinis]
VAPPVGLRPPYAATSANGAPVIPVTLLDEGGPFWTPIGGPFWTPIDTRDRRDRNCPTDHRDGEPATRLIRLSRIGGPSAGRIVDVAAIRLAKRERFVGLSICIERLSDLNRMLDMVALQRLDEQRIDRQARHRASMLNFHLNSRYHAGQSPHSDGEAVRPQ